MSVVPVLGRAVQAPSVSVPSSVPRVVVIQVVPTPTTAAMHSASRVTNISRTVSRLQFLREKGEAFSLGSAAAKLSGEGSALDETGWSGLVVWSEEVLVGVFPASSSIFCNCTRISTLRLVSTGGGPGLISGGFGAPEATRGCGNLVPMPTPASALISTPLWAVTMMSCQV